MKKKRLIKQAIIEFISQFSTESVIRSDDIVRHVKWNVGLNYVYPDTILRYARELRAEGKVNYICTNKQDRLFKITPNETV